MAIIERTNIDQQNTTQEIKEWSNKNLSKLQGWTQVLWKAKVNSCTLEG